MSFSCVLLEKKQFILYDYAFGVYTRAERNILSQGGYEDEEKILDRDPCSGAAAEPSAGDDAVGGGGRYVIDGD